MLELFDDGADHAVILAGIRDHVKATLVATGKGDGGQVARAEAAVRADPAGTIGFDADGVATVTAAGRRYHAGRFEVVTIGELRARALAARDRAGRPAVGRRLWVLDGGSVANDIGALQAAAAPGSLFQVASQFNCLESPGAYVVPIAEYFHDATQGPRASISAFPGTLVRHYAAPAIDGTRFVQRTDGRQLDLLAGVCDPGVAAVKSGYLLSKNIAQPAAFARALEDRFDAIAVGVHDGVEVVLGADWTGRVDGAPARRIAQVFTSTIAAGGYGRLPDATTDTTIVRQLQRAAYLGTLLAAAALGTRRVGLTMIGGGVFANPHPAIWEAIQWASDQVEPLLHADLSIVVNSFGLGHHVPPAELAAAARARGGALIRFARGGSATIDG